MVITDGILHGGITAGTIRMAIRLGEAEDMVTTVTHTVTLPLIMVHLQHRQGELIQQQTTMDREMDQQG